MKKLLAFCLALTMVIGLVTVAAQADEPIEILLWSTRGSGGNLKVVDHEIEEFNATIGAEKGIHISHEYQGNYEQLWNNFATASGELAPDLVALGNTYVPFALADDMLADMVPLAEADGYDLTGNLMDWVLQIGGNTDGQIHSLPYIRSTPVLYYNKTLADELNITINQNITIEELENFGKAAMKKDELGNTVRYGFEVLQDFGYMNAAWIYQLGSQFIAPEGGSPSLEDGTMLKVLSDWRRWVDEGWCRPFDASSGGSVALQEFAAGRLASYVASCSNMAGILENAASNGFEVGVAFFPTYNKDNHVAEIGGGNICINGDKDEAHIKAAWEFVKFVMSDSEQYFNSITTGYCPGTLSVANDPQMAKFWEEHPQYKVPFEQLLVAGRGQELPAVSAAQEFIKLCEEAAGRLIQAQETTAEEEVQRLKDGAALIQW